MTDEIYRAVYDGKTAKIETMPYTAKPTGRLKRGPDGVCRGTFATLLGAVEAVQEFAGAYTHGLVLTRFSVSEDCKSHRLTVVYPRAA